MLKRFIPIVQAEPVPPEGLLTPLLQPTRLSGQPERVEQLRAALEAAVALGLGHTPPGWLRELRLADGEAFVGLAPDLGHDSIDTAEIAFDTLRHLLPDTDIYVGAAKA